ncbi:MAG TPA: hypothetical protein VHO03_11770 [Ignavibacteriales bacterium]|nr:hypothetical protein [Ignavibacteriales bacterium]
MAIHKRFTNPNLKLVAIHKKSINTKLKLMAIQLKPALAGFSQMTSHDLQVVE